MFLVSKLRVQCSVLVDRLHPLERMREYLKTYHRPVPCSIHAVFIEVNILSKAVNCDKDCLDNGAAALRLINAS